MQKHSELDHLRRAHRRLKTRLDELERRIQHHLAAQNADPFAELVKSHSLPPHAPLPQVHPASVSQPASHDPAALPPLYFQI